MSGENRIAPTLRRLASRVAAALSWLDPYYKTLAMAVAILLSGSITYSAWDFARDVAENEARIRFDFRVSEMAEAIRGRMVDYEQVLRGGVGLFAASETVSRGEWHEYIERLRIREIYPGIQGIGFVQRVPAAEKAQHERSVRAEGFPDYAIWPAAGRAEYLPIVYIEPFAGRNLRSFGFDMFSEPVRRAAMERARDSGEPAISGKVTLVQETDEDVQAGFLMYVPVYRNGLDTPGVEQRRAGLAGYVYSPFRINNLMRGILGDVTDLRVEIIDGEVGGDTLYDSARDSASREPGHSGTTTLSMGGRTWTLRASSLPAFESTVDRRTPDLVALATGSICFLALAVIWLLADLGARAVRLARSMTRELRDSRERLALAIEGSNQALFDWDVRTGTIVLSEQWPRMRGGGLGSETTTLAELETLVHPDDLPKVLQELADLLQGRSLFYEVEHRVRTVTGGWCWIASRAKVVERDADGRAVRVAGTNVDVTERKEVERLKSQFIATVSHELRTPLTAIVGALGLLKEQSAGRLPADAATFLDMAQQNSERLANLINDILDMEKIESGRVEFQFESVAVRPLLERAVALNGPYAEKLDVRFELAQPLPDVTVAGDKDRLMQVMTNLLSNAAKFSPTGSAATISAEVRGATVRIAVADRGPGVPESFRGRIFEKFAQADGSDQRRKGGTGLGLSISKAIVEKLGGTIGYTSVPGKGATFYFDLPVKG